jgi:hypothetical protein
MVKITQAVHIEELIKREEEKFVQLEKIALGIWGKKNILPGYRTMHIRPENDPELRTRVLIDAIYFPKITVFDKNYFNSAMKFARIYEKAFKSEVTLTVDY